MDDQGVYPHVMCAVRHSERLFLPQCWEEARRNASTGLWCVDFVLDRIHAMFARAAGDYHSGLMRRCAEESRHPEYRAYVAAKLGLV